MPDALHILAQSPPASAPGDIFTQALEISAIGYAAIFVVMGAFILLIMLLGGLFPDKAE